MYELKSRFFEYATSSDNGTWNKGKFFKEVKVDVPSYSEQNKIVQVYDELDDLQKRMEKLKSEIEDLLMKQIAQD
jgi:restriction endonuclease S subunit